MAAFTLQLRTSRAEDGKAPIRLRISHHGRRRFLSVGLKARTRKWNAGKERVRRSHRNSGQINSRLSEIEQTAEDALVAIRARGETVTAGAVKEEIQRHLDGHSGGETRLIEYARQAFESHYDNHSTLKNARSSVRKMEGYFDTDPPISEVTSRTVAQFRRWLIAEQGLAENTADKHLSMMRRAVKMAIEEGIMPRSDDPFQSVSITRHDPQKEALSDPEIGRLERLHEELQSQPDPPPRTDTLALWLWSFYMQGMRYSDALTLEWTQIRGGRVRYEMRKTDQNKDVQVVTPGADILAHYRHREGERRFVWPVLDRYVVDPAWDLSDSNDMQRALNSRSGKMTRDLSTLEDEADLSTHITMHVARHTFARKAMDGGWTLQEIQAALGHKQISTTESYLRTLRDDELDEQHRELF